MISVIVPVYNVEKYVSKCIESIMAQDYTDLEIILVDDGSTDNSGKICDEYAAKDERIKVIHKKNGGLSDARNAGISASHGDYIGLIDGDDHIAYNMYSRLLTVLEKSGSDVAECRYKKVSDIDYMETCDMTEPRAFTTEEAIKELMLGRVLTQTTVNKLYKRDIIISKTFLKGVCNEDEFWTYKVFADCKKIVFINEELYYYFQRRGSIINSDFSIKRLDGLNALRERIAFVSERFPALVPYARGTYMGNCFYAYQRLCENSGKADPEKKHRKEIHHNFCEEWKKERIKPKAFRHKIWYMSFRLFPAVTCRIRNKFGIGL